MGIEFCPLADEVGNLADWMAVAVGGLATLATTVVAVMAYKTSERAAGIAEEAKRIAEQQHGEAVQAREAHARIIGRLLLHEVTALEARVTYYAQTLKSVIDDSGEKTTNWRRVATAITPLMDSLLPSAESMQEHLHNLRDSLGADAATVISLSRDINQLATHIVESVHTAPPIASGFATTFSYSGRPHALKSLQELLQFTAELAPGFISEFRVEVLGTAAEGASNLR